MPESKRIWQKTLARFLGAFAKRAQNLPREKAMRWGERLGSISYVLGVRQRAYAHRNLRLVYGDSMTVKERDALIRRVFTHFAKTGVDFVRGPLLQTRADRDALIPHVEGWDEYARPALAQGKGVIFLSAHFGNWELLGRWIASEGVPITVVARPPANGEFATWLRDLRKGSGLEVASKGGSVRALLSVLKRGDALGVLPDQNSGDVFAPFFGVPAGTPAGPSALALKTGAVLIPVYCPRQSDDTYKLIFRPPLPVRYDVPAGERDAETLRIMTDTNRLLEEMVRAYPDQWLWLHNRWKAAFEEKNRARWPAQYEGLPFAEALRRWLGEPFLPPAGSISGK